MAPALVVAVALGYLLLLVAVAAWADRRAVAGRPVVGAWIYTLSLGVYCSAWTYFGSVGRAAAGGLGFLTIYLGPTLAMALAWIVVRKMVRAAREYRITTIGDFVARRHGGSAVLAGAVTALALVGIVPYVALQLKAIAATWALLAGAPAGPGPWWSDAALWAALALAGFAIAFGARRLDTSERHAGLVAAMALESAVKLVAFVAVGVFVVWGLHGGPSALMAAARAEPALASVLAPPRDGAAWFTLTLLAGLSVLLLPRQFQLMVVENVDERHLRRAAWAFPAYLLAINVFVLPIALGGLLFFGPGGADPETFVLSLPLAGDAPALALLAFVGGLSAATGMVVVEATAVATMVCNDLVLPWWLRRGSGAATGARVLAIRRAVIVALLLLGWLYYRVAGEAYALVSIGLISFAAVAQFAPPMLGGLFWRGGTARGALAGLAAGAALWAWTLLLPSIARSGWLPSGFVDVGPFGVGWLKPNAMFGLAGLDSLTHGLFWSLLANAALYVGVSLARPPSAREAVAAHQFVDVFAGGAGERVFWRGRARVGELVALLGRFVGDAEARRLVHDHARQSGAPVVDDAPATPPLVQFVETRLSGAIGGAAARAMVASVVDEEPLTLPDVVRIVEEAGALREANAKLRELDRLKDDFMSSVSHELRTPLASIRALTEIVRDTPEMDAAQRQHFIGLVVAETERLTRLVDQVLDLAKIESGHARWNEGDVDARELLAQVHATAGGMLRERGAELCLELPPAAPPLRADRDRLQQVLMNLVSNAAKFVPPEHGRAVLRLVVEPRALRVEVDDNGPGVAPADRERIFEKFRQGSGARRPGGTGLGLAISRQIVEHSGGRLSVEDAPGGGARFVVRLPTRKEREETTP